MRWGLAWAAVGMWGTVGAAAGVTLGGTTCLRAEKLAEGLQKGDKGNSAYFYVAATVGDAGFAEACNIFDDAFTFVTDSAASEVYIAVEAARAAKCRALQNPNSIVAMLRERLVKTLMKDDLGGSAALLHALVLADGPHADKQCEWADSVHLSRYVDALKAQIRHYVSERRQEYDDMSVYGYDMFMMGHVWTALSLIVHHCPESASLKGEEDLKQAFIQTLSDFEWRNVLVGSVSEETAQNGASLLRALYRFRKAMQDWAEGDMLQGAFFSGISYLVKLLNSSTNAVNPNWVTIFHALRALQEIDADGEFVAIESEIHPKLLQEKVDVTIKACSMLGNSVTQADGTHLQLRSADGSEGPQAKWEPSSKVLSLSLPINDTTPYFDTSVELVVDSPEGSAVAWSLRTAILGSPQVKVRGVSVKWVPSRRFGDDHAINEDFRASPSAPPTLPPAPARDATDAGELFISATVADRVTGLAVRPRQLSLRITRNDPRDTDNLSLPVSIQRASTSHSLMPRIAVFGVYALKLPLDSEDLVRVSGSYDLTILAGDPSFAFTPSETKIGSIDLEFFKPTNFQTIDVPGGHREIFSPAEESWHPRHLIAHQFPPPRKYPAFFVTAVFLLLCTVVPLGGLGYAMWRSEVNFANFPQWPDASESQLATSPNQDDKDESTSVFLWHAAFQVLFGLCLSLIVYFWVALTLFQVLKAFVPLGLVTTYVGHRVLCDLRARRLSVEDSHKQD